MEKLGLGLDDDSNKQQATATLRPGDSGCLSIQRCMQSLVHACQCCNANRSLPSCQKMKRVVQHAKGCKRKPMVDGSSADSFSPSAGTMPSTARRTKSGAILPQHQAKAPTAAGAAPVPTGSTAPQEDGQHAGDRCGGTACRGQVWWDSSRCSIGPNRLRCSAEGWPACRGQCGRTAAGPAVPNSCYSTI